MKKTGNISVICGAILLAVLLCTQAKEASGSDQVLNIEASVDANRIGLQDNLTLTVTIDTENLARVPKPVLPDLKYFTVVNESTRSEIKTSFISGKMTRTKTLSYIYTLKPLKKGTFTIDPVSVTYGNVVYKTEPMTVTVVEGQVKEGGTALPFKNEVQIDPEKLKKDIFILTRPESIEIYEGEQLFLTYTLYSLLEIDSISLRESPDFPGFYKEDIYNASRLEGKRETYNKKVYDTTLLKKVAVYPLKSGTYMPRPLVLEVATVIKEDDLLSFLDRPYSFFIKSNDVTITVKPLPQNQTGKSFSNITGSLEVHLTKIENTVNTGESTTCYLTFKSPGNLNNLSDPGINLSKRGRVYLSDTITDRIEEGNTLYMIKKFEYTIIPEESGTLEIRTNNFLYFDPKTESYVSAAAEPIEINIIGKDIYPEKPIMGSKKEFAGGGLQYIKGDVKRLYQAPPPPFQSTFFYLYHIAIAACVGFIMYMRLKRENLEKNESLYRRKKARTSAARLLKEAEEKLVRKSYTDAVDLTEQALITYIAHKAEKNPIEVSLKTVDSILSGFFKTDEQTRSGIRSVLEQCSMLKYSSFKGDRPGLIRDIHSKTSMFIEQLELAESSKGTQGIREVTR